MCVPQSIGFTDEIDGKRRISSSILFAMQCTAAVQTAIQQRQLIRISTRILQNIVSPLYIRSDQPRTHMRLGDQPQ